MTDNEKYQHFSQIATEYLGKENELSGDKREISLIAFTEMEVNSSGLLAFVEHSSHNTRQEIYRIYEKIGAKKCLTVFQQLQKLLDTEPELCNPNETDERNDEYWNALYRINEFDKVTELEETYWEVSEECFVLAYDYYSLK